MKYLRALTTAAVTFSAALAPLAMTGGADAAVKRKSAKTPVSYIRVVTLNTEYPQPDRAALADVKRLVDARIPVIALQETMGKARRTAIAARFVDCSTCVYDGYLAQRNTEGATPILWNSRRFALVDSGNEQVTEDWYVGPAGAGPSTFQEKFITWVQLRDRATGRSFFVLNTHFIPSVQGAGGYPNTKLPARLEHFQQHMSALQALVTTFRETGLPVLVTGDFNVNFRRDKVIRPEMFPYASLDAVGARATFAAVGEPGYGSHVGGDGKRLIDYVAYTLGPRLSPVRNGVMLGFNSDHRPVWARFALY